ncbi:MAG: hypothetical protein B6242_11530 [Anaerolineaceae bacterium 4572_78]|nr:MAG: hypothetical protein B6242_11530 [Anaerolineaceae bacterium 4572_78]
MNMRFLPRYRSLNIVNNRLKNAHLTMLYLVRKRLGMAHLPKLHYVSPNANWVTDEIGNSLVTEITRQYHWSANVTSTADWLAGQIVHYSELGVFLNYLTTSTNRHNTIIITVFHGNREGNFKKNVDLLINHMHIPTRILTACHIMKKRLLHWGATPEQVVLIPLGVDLSIFKPVSAEKRLEIRHKIGVPDDAFCIGSFQKDGSGWEQGLTPKLVKGPDIFLKVIERLHKTYKLFIILTAPARGYVKQGLEKLGIPYKHVILTDYHRVANYYNALDVYLMTSREEGGPKSVLESLASGISLVSTRVGLAPDVIHHEFDGLLADSEDVNTLAEHVAYLIENQDIRQKLIKHGLETIQVYDWKHIVARYYHELYLPVLHDLTALPIS